MASYISSRKGCGGGGPPFKPPMASSSSSESGLKLVKCPYNSSHQVMSDQIDAHVDRCRQDYKRRVKEIPYFSCKFNFKHQIPAPELLFHESRCEDGEYVPTYLLNAALEMFSDGPDFQRLEPLEPTQEELDRMYEGLYIDTFIGAASFGKPIPFSKIPLAGHLKYVPDEWSQVAPMTGVGKPKVSEEPQPSTSKRAVAPSQEVVDEEDEDEEEDWSKGNYRPTFDYMQNFLNPTRPLLKYPPMLKTKSQRKGFVAWNKKWIDSMVDTESPENGQEQNMENVRWKSGFENPMEMIKIPSSFSISAEELNWEPVNQKEEPQSHRPSQKVVEAVIEKETESASRAKASLQVPKFQPVLAGKKKAYAMRDASSQSQGIKIPNVFTMTAEEFREDPGHSASDSVLNVPSVPIQQDNQEGEGEVLNLEEVKSEEELVDDVSTGNPTDHAEDLSSQNQVAVAVEEGPERQEEEEMSVEAESEAIEPPTPSVEELKNDEDDKQSQGESEKNDVVEAEATESALVEVEVEEEKTEVVQPDTLTTSVEALKSDEEQSQGSCENYDEVKVDAPKSALEEVEEEKVEVVLPEPNTSSVEALEPDENNEQSQGQSGKNDVVEAEAPESAFVEVEEEKAEIVQPEPLTPSEEALKPDEDEEESQRLCEKNDEEKAESPESALAEVEKEQAEVVQPEPLTDEDEAQSKGQPEKNEEVEAETAESALVDVEEEKAEEVQPEIKPSEPVVQSSVDIQKKEVEVKSSDGNLQPEVEPAPEPVSQAEVKVSVANEVEEVVKAEEKTENVVQEPGPVNSAVQPVQSQPSRFEATNTSGVPVAHCSCPRPQMSIPEMPLLENVIATTTMLIVEKFFESMARVAQSGQLLSLAGPSTASGLPRGTTQVGNRVVEAASQSQSEPGPELPQSTSFQEEKEEKTSSTEKN